MARDARRLRLNIDRLLETKKYIFTRLLQTAKFVDDSSDECVAKVPTRLTHN